MAKIKHLAFEKFLALHLKKAGKISARLSQKMESKRFNRLERLRYLASLAERTEAQTTLPLTIGREVSLTQYGVLGHSFMQSRSLEELFQNIHRNLWVLDPNNRSGLTFRKVDREFQLIYPEPPIWPELPYFFLDLFFSALLQQSRELSGWPLE
ncbi:MAG: AraC family transcriptional regulator ligand-binding domain-containing protein, partial [Sneathiella sp.]|nr:AraC family transcriptional regulator ligand-binding domain-containing protein [Sneathiella sp.]